jgi:hypothetical protein
MNLTYIFQRFLRRKRLRRYVRIKVDIVVHGYANTLRKIGLLYSENISTVEKLISIFITVTFYYD